MTAALGATALLGACGGGGGESASPAATATTTAGAIPTAANAPQRASAPAKAKTTASSAAQQPGQGAKDQGAAASFEDTGGDNSIQRYGGEAAASELKQAAASLHAYLDARAAGDWKKACVNLAAGVAKSLQQLAGGGAQAKRKQVGCPQLLASMSAGMPASLKRDLTQAEVGALRTTGSRGFLLYRGAQHTSYFMPMAREGGGWRVAAIAASALP